MRRPGRGALVLALWLAGLAALVVPIAVRAQAARVNAIAQTMPSVVVVLAVDTRSGELEPMAAGSGTIVDSDGAVLTNHHVLYDAARTRLYDLFLIGRFRAADREPELYCAGIPASGELRPDLDLALLRCDSDLNGQPWWPENWPALPLGDSRKILPGEQVWVLGYPNAGGGLIHVSAGLVSGWTGEHGGAASRAFMRTDATISAGNSGGAAADRFGRLIGVPTAFRTITAERGGAVAAMGKVGLIRPIELARELIDTGRRGWRGDLVLVSGTTTDASSLRPIQGAVVVAFSEGVRTPRRAGVEATARGLGGVDGAVEAWSTTDATGRFILEPPLERGRRYTIGVTAPGYLPAAERDALEIPGDGVHRMMPWREIRLQPDDPL